MIKFGLRARSAAVGVSVFLLMSFMTFLFIRYFSADIARDLGSKYAQENAMRYAEKIKGTINFDVTLTQKLASSIPIGEWAVNEKNLQQKQEVFAILNDYLEVSKAGSWFIAFEKSGHYYFNDANGSHTGSEYIKTLESNNYNDSWFFHTLKSPDPYNLNIDYDEALGLTKLWLNMPIVHNGKRIGVIGVGFDYTRFIDEYIAEDKEGFTTMILNAKGVIVAHKEKRYVNYKSEVVDSTSWITLASLVDKGHNEAEFSKQLALLAEQKINATSFDLYLNGRHYIASATYLPQLKWINLSMVDLDNIFGMREMAIIGTIFIILAFLSWVFIFMVSERYLISPIRAISEVMRRIKDGDYSVRLNAEEARCDEIGELCRNINEMAERIEDSAKDAKQQYQWLADNMSDVIWIMELNGHFSYISPSVERLRGFTPKEVMNQSLDKVICQGSMDEVQKSMADAFADVAAGKIPKAMTIMIEQPHKNGSTIWTEVNARLILDDEGKPFRFIGVTRDASQRIKAEEEIRKLAFYDPLTSLANRRLLLDRLEQAIVSAKRTGSYGGLIYLDLDRFKPLNDRFGHDAGDELLIEVGRRIQECIRATDTAARFGGDEFVILVNDLGVAREEGFQYTESIAKKIQMKLSLPYELKMTTYILSASVGISLFGPYSSSTREAIIEVDKLMYEAKEARRDEYKGHFASNI
ncbi:MAG: diguanylate cyclase [Sulfuricurvum sp.]|nr:diguanylate cyclase [Sulfuricurvum sp.]